MLCAGVYVSDLLYVVCWCVCIRFVVCCVLVCMHQICCMLCAGVYASDLLYVVCWCVCIRFVVCCVLVCMHQICCMLCAGVLPGDGETNKNSQKA